MEPADENPEEESETRAGEMPPSDSWYQYLFFYLTKLGLPPLEATHCLEIIMKSTTTTAIDRFEAHLQAQNKVFEALREVIHTTLEAQNQTLSTSLEAQNQILSHQNRRLSHQNWLIGLLFTALILAVALVGWLT